MIKEEKPIFFKVFLIVVFILIINLAIFSYKIVSNGSLTGLSISEKISESYKSISSTSKIFLIVQWVVLIFLMVGILFKDRGLGSNKVDEIDETDVKNMSEGSDTDLDVLYNILRKKKQLRVSSISRTFKVSNEVAIGWCKILESGNLGVLEYTSSDVIIKLVE